MESSGKCMNNDASLTTIGGDSHASGVTLGSHQVWGGKGYDLDMKQQG